MRRFPSHLSFYSIYKGKNVFGGLFVLLMLVILMLPSPGSLAAWNSFSGPVGRMDTEGKLLVSLTFETLDGGRNTDKILEVLAARNIHATFFVEGRWAALHREETYQIFQAGHEIGNHSYNHARSLSEASPEEQKEDLNRCSTLLKEVTGIQPSLFRPPYGTWSEDLIFSADSLGMQTILWDVDALDWKEGSPQKICDIILKSCGPGSILRFQQGGLSTPEALEACVDALQQEGYHFVTVSELLAEI